MGWPCRRVALAMLPIAGIAGSAAARNTRHAPRTGSATSQRCLQTPRCLQSPPAPLCVQGELMMVAVQLMLGGSLRSALLDPERQQQLRWEAR